MKRLLLILPLLLWMSCEEDDKEDDLKNDEDQQILLENLIIYTNMDYNAEHIYEIHIMNYKTLEKQVLTEGLHAAWNHNGSKILFLNEKYLYSIDVDGANLNQLIYNEYFDYPITGTQLHLSPNGESLLLNLYDGNNFQITTIKTDGSSIEYLTNNSYKNLYPEWSPDGTKIKFVSDRNNGQYSPEMNIYIINADGTNELQLTNNVDSWQMANSTWSIDGSKIYYLWYKDDGFDLMEVNINDGSTSLITHLELTGSRDAFSAFQLSSDGEYIFFVSENSFFKIRVGGSNQTLLFGESDGYEIGNIYGIDLSNDSLLVISNGNNILMINENGTNPVILTNNEETNVLSRYPRLEP